MGASRRGRRFPTTGRCRDPIACVVAKTMMQAKIAAEAVAVDIDPLPAATDSAGGPCAPGAAAALMRGAQTISRSTTIWRCRAGRGGVREGTSPCHTSRARKQPSRGQRGARARGALFYQDGPVTLYVPRKGWFGMRGGDRQVMGVEPQGSCITPENYRAARSAGRPGLCRICRGLHAGAGAGGVREVDDERSGSFVSDHHGRPRTTSVTAELALVPRGTSWR